MRRVLRSGCSQMTSRRDWSGRSWGSLIAVRYVRRKTDGARWLFRCDCGIEKVMPVRLVRNGKRTSCGTCTPAPPIDPRGMAFPDHNRRRWNRDATIPKRHTQQGKMSALYTTGYGSVRQVIETANPLFDYQLLAHLATSAAPFAVGTTGEDAMRFAIALSGLQHSLGARAMQ
jgi:hypothetical protein